MRRLRRASAVFIALAVAGGLAACGDDNDSATTDTTTAGTSDTSAKATDAVDVAMKEYSYTISGDLKAGGTIRLSNTGKQFHMMGLAKLKPGATLADVVTALQSAGPPGGDDSGGSSTTVGGSQSSTTAGAQSSTTAGDASSTTVAGDQADEGQQDPTAQFVDDVGAPGTFMGPGQKAEITVPELAAGTYVMVCFIPEEGGGPPHFTKGMVGQLTVVGDKATEPTADATFNVEAGKPITGPSTLSAGKHVLKIAAAEGSDELEPGLAKLNPGKTVSDINEAFAAFETPTDFVLPVNAAATIPGQLVASVFDFGPARTVYLGVDLTAGTYGIVSNDTDVDNAPNDPVEKITFTVT